MPEEQKINLQKLEEIIALIITKKEDPSNKELSFFGWDDRYELHGKKGVIFDDFGYKLSMLRAIGLQEEYWNVTYSFIDFGQLLSLYPYTKCMLDILEAHRHRDDIQRLFQQIKDIENTLSSLHEQLKDIEKNTFNEVLKCTFKK